jgi:hypothetical protein
MSIETLIRDNPALTLVTLVGGTAAAATLMAYRDVGRKPSHPKGSISGLIRKHPIISAAGIIGAAMFADHLVRSDRRRGGTVTGATRAAAARRAAPPSGHQAPSAYRAPSSQSPGGGSRPGGMGGFHPPTVSPYGPQPGHASTMHGMPASSASLPGASPSMHGMPAASASQPSYGSPSYGAMSHEVPFHHFG